MIGSLIRTLSLCALFLSLPTGAASAQWSPLNQAMETLLTGVWVEMPKAGFEDEAALEKACDRPFFEDPMDLFTAKHGRMKTAHPALSDARGDLQVFRQDEAVYIADKLLGTVFLTEFQSVMMQAQGGRFRLMFQKSPRSYRPDRGDWRRMTSGEPGQTVAEGAVMPLPSGVLTAQFIFPLNRDGSRNPSRTKNYMRCGDLRPEAQNPAEQ